MTKLLKLNLLKFLNKDSEFICRVKPPDCIIGHVNNRFGPPGRAARQLEMLMIIWLNGRVYAQEKGKAYCCWPCHESPRHNTCSNYFEMGNLNELFSPTEMSVKIPVVQDKVAFQLLTVYLVPSTLKCSNLHIVLVHCSLSCFAPPRLVCTVAISGLYKILNEKQI